MPSADPVREGDRLMTICNACRYCEGYCAVFPAMEKRLNFAEADLNYLANLCHNCAECYYACQYAPPHEFAVNVPQVLAGIRERSYRKYAVFGLYDAPLLIALALGLFIVRMLVRVRPHPPADFYGVIPHVRMVAAFGTAGLLAAVLLAIGALRFWRESELPSPSGGSLVSALRDILQLRYLSSNGAGCTYPNEHHSQARRWFHHLTFYGFLLCFASTTVAAVYHTVFGWIAPYGYFSAPVILGTLGGIGLLIGPAGLYFLKQKRDPAIADPKQDTADLSFIALLFLTSATGLALLAFRGSFFMSRLLLIHLGFVMALFLKFPYGKFVHGIYRAIALVRYALEGLVPEIEV